MDRDKKRKRVSSPDAFVCSRDPEHKSKDNLKQFLSSCKRQKRLTDFKIFCAGKVHDTHRVVLSAQSRFFEGAYNSDFKEGQSQQITLKDNPNLVELLLKYFYDLDYDDGFKTGEKVPTDGQSEVESPVLPLTISARMYIMADKYGVPSLKVLALAKTKKIFNSGPSIWWCKDFSSAVKWIWTTLPASEQELCNKYLTKFLAHRKLMLSLEDESIAELRAICEFLFDAYRLASKSDD